MVFEDTIIKANKDRVQRTISFQFSLLLHALIILFILVVPLITIKDFPKIDIYSVVISSPPVPPPPPPPPIKKRSRNSVRTRIRPIQSKTNFTPSQLIVPVKIPDEIADEELADIGIEGGIEGGVEGGVIGGVLGGVVGGVLGGVLGGELETPVRAVGQIRPPKLIKMVDPIYPEAARQARVQGVVIIEAMTDIYGLVQSVKILRSIPLLDEAAITAVRQWIYEPLIIDSKPRPVIFTVTISFVLK